MDILQPLCLHYLCFAMVIDFGFFGAAIPGNSLLAGDLGRFKFLIFFSIGCFPIILSPAQSLL